MKFDFFRSAFSEPDGTGSSTRLIIACLVSFVVGSGVSMVTHIHGPISVQDFNSFLSSAGVFLATTCGPLYLINKGSAVMNQEKKG
jgi:hypothetical protein